MTDHHHTPPPPPPVPEVLPTEENPYPSPAVNADKFRKAKIIKFMNQNSYGFVKDYYGNEIYFHLDELRLVGDKINRSQIYEGVDVGIDVGRTSRGLRVTKMKVY